MKFGAGVDLYKFIPFMFFFFFFFFHPWFSGQVGELCVTVHYVRHYVFKLGQNVLRCSAIVDEERLFLIFF